MPIRALALARTSPLATIAALGMQVAFSRPAHRAPSPLPMNVLAFRAHVTHSIARWFPHARVECVTETGTMTLKIVVKGRTPAAGLVRRVPLVGPPEVVEARAQLALELLLEELGAHRLVLRPAARARVSEARRPDVVLVDRRGRVSAERAHDVVESFASLDEFLRAFGLAHEDLTPA